MYLQEVVLTTTLSFVQGQQNLYIIEFKQVCTRRSIASVYEKQYAQSSRTNLWLLLAYKRKFFGQITASDTPLLRIEVISPITSLHGMAEIIIAKHRNGAVGDVLLRFRGEFARFQNPDDDVIVPMPGEAPGIIRSKMNGGGNNVPPPSPDAAPADNNPFGTPIPEGPLPF